VSSPYLESYAAGLQQLRRDHGVTGLVTGDIEDVAGGFMAGARPPGHPPPLTGRPRCRTGPWLAGWLDGWLAGWLAGCASRWAARPPRPQRQPWRRAQRSLRRAPPSRVPLGCAPASCRLASPGAEHSAHPNAPPSRLRARCAAAAAAAGFELITPLWQLGRHRILAALLGLGIRARISCVALAKFAGPAAATGPDGGANGAAPGGAAGQQQQTQQKQQLEQEQQQQLEQQQQQEQEQKQKQQQEQEEEGQQQQHEQQLEHAPTNARQASCGCHCVPAPLVLGPPLFDAAGELLGRELTQALIDGPLARAAAAAGIDAAGEDGSFHTVVTACPQMRGRRVALDGRPRVDEATGYAYMEWASVGVEDVDAPPGGAPRHEAAAAPEAAAAAPSIDAPALQPRVPV
jgi:flagellar motor protein MotB